MLLGSTPHTLTLRVPLGVESVAGLRALLRSGIAGGTTAFTVDLDEAPVLHHYPERSVRLKFFRCRWLRYEPKPILCDRLAWITAAELSNYAFPAADTRLLDKLRHSPELW